MRIYGPAKTVADCFKYRNKIGLDVAMEVCPNLLCGPRDATLSGGAHMNSRRPLRNLASSVRQRLLNLAKEKQKDFQLVLTRYALQRTMYRLSRSAHRSQFILKGTLLFSLWSDDPHRPTRDLDLLGRGTSNISRLEEIFREIITTQVEDDGLEFRKESVRGERIREDQEYEGARIHFEARLAAARITVQVDVGFGDAINPPAEEMEYPTLLDFPKPHLLATHVKQ